MPLQEFETRDLKKALAEILNDSHSFYVNKLKFKHSTAMSLS